MKLLYATIIKTEHGSDHVSLVTDLPNPVWPFGASRDSLSLAFRCAKGASEKYLAEHFPDVPIKEVISI